MSPPEQPCSPLPTWEGFFQREQEYIDFLRVLPTAGSRSLPLPRGRTFLLFLLKCKLSPSPEIPPLFLGCSSNWYPELGWKVGMQLLNSWDVPGLDFLRDIRGEAGEKFCSAADLQHQLGWCLSLHRILSLCCRHLLCSHHSHPELWGLPGIHIPRLLLEGPRWGPAQN